MNVKISIFLCTVVFVSDSLYTNKRIIGGQKVDLTYIPYQAQLIVDGEFACGATLITQLHLLSAAHCLDELILSDKPLEVLIHVGSIELNKGTPYAVKRISHHKGFNRSSETYLLPDDIGVIHLYLPIPITYLVRPISLPAEGNEVFDETPVIISGFGANDLDGPASEKLTKIVVKTTSLSICQKHITSYRLKDTHLCVISPAGVGCSPGDDGSPMTDISQISILGIVSVGNNGCGEFPDIFTKVSSYMSYILEEIREEYKNEQAVSLHPFINYDNRTSSLLNVDLRL